MQKKVTSVELKQINRNNVYRAIISRQETSKQEIAQLLHLSIPTVAQNISELMNMGLVQDAGKFQSTGGRKAKIIAGKSTARVAFGLDITQNHINLVMADLAFNVLMSRRRRIGFEMKEEYFRVIRKMLREAISEVDVPPNNILGVGVSIPAIVKADNKTIEYAPLLNGAEYLFDRLSQCIDYPFFIMNDANAGGYAELHCGIKKENFFYVQLSNTVGGAVILDEKLLYGGCRRAGEVGHSTLVIDGRPCYCGKIGCVDSYCSSLLLANAAGGDLDRFFGRLRADDPGCAKVWEVYVHYLSIVINNIRVSFDCDIVLGGYVGRYIKPYLNVIRKKAAERCTFTTDGSYIYATGLNTEASALGAALFHINQFINQV